ncbi:MAG: DNA primase [Candidatus Methanomethylophilaceae archaeon]|nr:DNA primase [Candidatus Methanomethylophilaceae archaeon]
MHIPDHIVEQIRNASDIVEVVGGYLPLKRRGREFIALCPFHSEKTPSFNVIPHKQIFYCFGCHKGGDVFKFLSEYESISYPEAIQRLADRAGIEIEFEQGPDSRERARRDTLYRIHEEFTQYWHEQLLKSPEGQIARDYLVQRGVSEQSTQDFRLGYSPLAWEDTPRRAQHLNLDFDLLVESGLALQKEGRSGGFGRFRGRIMFPIADDQGRVIGFSARALYPDDSKMGKYVNSPETPLFHKSNVVFGLDHAKREIIQKRCAIICEGQLDLIACHSAGFKNTVAPQGTAFTLEQARILKRLAPELILCFDGDEAGQNAAVKALDTFLAADLNARVAFLPAGSDPDSFIKSYGADAFGELIKRSREFFDFYLSRLCQQNNKESDRGRLQIVRSMGEALQKANQPLLTDTYAQKTAQLLGVSPQTVLDEFARCKKAQPPAAYNVDRTKNRPRTDGDTGAFTDERSPAAMEYTPPTPRERWLLILFLMNESEWDWMAHGFQPEWVKNSCVREIIVAALDQHCAGEYSPHHLLQSFPDPFSQQLLCSAMAQDGEVIPEPAQQLRELIQALRAQHCDHLLRSLNQRLNAPGISVEEQTELLQQKERIRQIRNSPLFGV